MRHGERSTIYAVAERARVSTATVSRVLRGTAKVNDATKERVLGAIAALHYVPSGAASHLASRSSADLGLILPATAGPYFGDVIVGFESEAGRLGYAVGLAFAEKSDGFLAAVSALAERCEGLLFAARSAVSDEMIRSLTGARAIVTVARGHVAGLDNVLAENYATAYELTSHLLDTGRRYLCFIGRVDPLSDLYDRYRGFGDAHRDRGIEPHPAIPCDLDEAGGIAVSQRLAEHQGLDGAVCGNDLVAVALHRHLQRAGYHIGHDIALVGWDDIHAARYVDPGLTTVSQPTAELAREAARHLHDQLKGEPARTEPTVLPTTVVYRGSCCPRHAARQASIHRHHPSEHEERS